MTDSERPETWKGVPGFSKYEGSDLGRVRSARTGNVLATRVSNSGYLLVKLYDDDGKQQTRSRALPDPADVRRGPAGRAWSAVTSTTTR